MPNTVMQLLITRIEIKGECCNFLPEQKLNSQSWCSLAITLELTQKALKSAGIKGFRTLWSPATNNTRIVDYFLRKAARAAARTPKGA